MKNCVRCDECRHKERSAEKKRSLQNRLKRVEGQVRGIQNMLDNDIYCVDILMQTQAAKKALEAFMRELLNDHINTCVKEGIRSGNEQIVDELTDVLYKLK